MATYTLTPNPYETILDANGNPVGGGLVTSYIAGTSTLTPTFADASGTPNSNPQIADSAGRWVAYLAVGVSYKFVVTTPLGILLKTVDNITAVPGGTAGVDILGTLGETVTAGQTVYLSDGSGSRVAGLWYKADSGNAYSSTLPEIGMVPIGITTGQAGTIRLSGQITGLSSLTVGAPYYVGSAGALTSIAPALRRLVGMADSTTTLVLSANPPTLALSVAQGGTGVATVTAHSVLVGEGTNAIVGAPVGLVGQVLAGAGAAADPLFVGGATLLKSGSGTSTAAGATTVDSIAVTGLTANDRILVFYEVESVTQLTTAPFLYSVTDSLNLCGLDAQNNIAAGLQVSGQATLCQRQSGATAVRAVSQSLDGAGSTATPTSRGDVENVTVTTAWTGAWTLGLRHGGVVAGGTFSWTWLVMRVSGQ